MINKSTYIVSKKFIIKSDTNKEYLLLDNKCHNIIEKYPLFDNKFLIKIKNNKLNDINFKINNIKK